MTQITATQNTTPSGFCAGQTKRRTPVLHLATGVSARTLSKVAPKLAALWLERIFITPRKFARPEREIHWMAGADTRWVTIDGGTKVPVYTWGTGPTVLLVHGMSGRASQMAAFVKPLMDQGFQVVAFDAPAHGQADGKQTTLPEIAAVLLQLGEVLGPLHAIVAHSIGAAATTIALSQGMDAGRAVCISAPEDLRAYLHRLARLTGFSEFVADLAQAKLEERTGFEFEALRGRSLAPAMKTPALMFHDKKDRMVPFSEGQTNAARWPGAELIATEGLGHSRILRDQDVIRVAIRFLAIQRAVQLFQ